MESEDEADITVKIHARTLSKIVRVILSKIEVEKTISDIKVLLMTEKGLR
jgi:hypothetical protein